MNTLLAERNSCSQAANATAHNDELFANGGHAENS
jgi:hypothetical protein